MGFTVSRFQFFFISEMGKNKMPFVLPPSWAIWDDGLRYLLKKKCFANLKEATESLETQAEGFLDTSCPLPGI